ncbi:MAG: tyrosine-type recombinase/integrase [Devosia sp.]
MSLTGNVSDIDSSTCQAYFAFVNAPRSASRDLELLRAACNHSNGQKALKGVVKVWLPPRGQPRQRWLTRSELARLLWTAWRSKRTANGRSGGADGWHTRKHLARFILVATYTGSRKQDVLNACFDQRADGGFVDLQRGVWIRKPAERLATKKRQTAIPLPVPLIGHMRRWHKSGQSFAVEFNGRPVQNITKAFRSLVVDSGLSADVVPHVLRHTGVTWGMQNGMDIWDASGYFGMTVQVLTDVYGHHHPDHLRDAAARMGRRR